MAISGGGLHCSGVGDMVGLGNFLSLREIWVGQPWPKAGRASVMEAGAAGGEAAPFFMFLSLNKSPDRDMTGPWHATSPSSTTQRV